jgi:hypothetical protein
MTLRRRLAALAAAALAVLLLAGQSPSELRRRAVAFSRFAPRELAVRRLGGSGAAFDRRYFEFLESARRRLPPGDAGVAVAGAPASDAHVYLATYVLAPRPVRFGPGRPPAGWFVATFGAEPPASEATRVRLPGGSLEGPLP